MKEILIDYFTFTKSQTRGILTLFFLILIVRALIFILPSWVGSKNEVPSSEFKRMISSLRFDSLSSESNSNYANSKFKPSKLTPFRFNPNILDEAGFKRLGLRDKLVSTILNYRNKGGKFYNKESLKRIYGLHEEEFNQLEAYIEIPNENRYTTTFKPKNIQPIELNTADTSQLIQLNGIGAKLSMNIVRYREQLGGFARVEQLKEVYGISEPTFEKIREHLYINKKLLKTINLNEATLYELNTHPYFRGDLARALVDFRKSQNYKIDNLNQIKEIPLINEEIFRKIVPYLRI